MPMSKEIERYDITMRQLSRNVNNITADHTM